MSTAPTVSIIVPVYAVEKYLPQCLDSIAAQTLADFECIVVDDGSPDACGAIADSRAAHDSRFRVIHTPNRGVAAARNTGLAAATGEFIAFVDPDDWIEPQMMATLAGMLADTGADAAQVGFWREFNGFSRPKRLFGAPRTITGDEAFRALIHDKDMPSYLWNKMFRRSITAPDFPEGKTFEDIYALSRWYRRISTMAVDPTPLYHYRIRRGSILNGDYAQNRLDYMDVCRYRASLMAAYDPGTYTPAYTLRYLTRAAVGAAKAIARFETDIRKRRDAIARLSEELKQFPSCSIKALGPKTWLRAQTLRRNPRCFERQMRLVFTADFQSRHRFRHIYD